MPRGVRVADFQVMQRAEDVAVEEAPSIADELRGLPSNCTAEMSLHMITERVREAARLAGLGETASEADIVHEAERIWGSFDVNRRGPREYDVDADGSVRDWRRPEMTPDRGDEAIEQARAADDAAEQGDAFDVPSDGAFHGKPFARSAKLQQMAGDLIERHDYFGHLEECTISYWWQRKTGVSKGQRVTGGIKRGSGHYGQLLGAEFTIWLAADTARERQFSERRVERALFRQLRRIGRDDKGNWIELPYNLMLFTEEIAEYADVGDEDLAVGRGAFRDADQLGLFDTGTDEAEADDA